MPSSSVYTYAHICMYLYSGRNIQVRRRPPYGVRRYVCGGLRRAKRLSRSAGSLGIYGSRDMKIAVFHLDFSFFDLSSLYSHVMTLSSLWSSKGEISFLDQLRSFIAIALCMGVYTAVPPNSILGRMMIEWSLLSAEAVTPGAGNHSDTHQPDYSYSPLPSLLCFPVEDGTGGERVS